jgi:hypothetical protein
MTVPDDDGLRRASRMRSSAAESERAVFERQSRKTSVDPRYKP